MLGYGDNPSGAGLTEPCAVACPVTSAVRVILPGTHEFGAAMESGTWVDFDVDWSQADTANTAGSVAANELRIALGLPPVPQMGR